MEKQLGPKENVQGKQNENGEMLSLRGINRCISDYFLISRHVVYFLIYFKALIFSNPYSFRDTLLTKSWLVTVA
jgi:hypothetical protein